MGWWDLDVERDKSMLMCRQYLLNEKLCSYFIFQLRTFRLLLIKVLKWFAITDLIKENRCLWHEAPRRNFFYSWLLSFRSSTKKRNQLHISSSSEHWVPQASISLFISVVLMLLLSEWFRGRRFCEYVYTHITNPLFSLKIIVVVVVILLL